MPERLLALDVGTTSARALLSDAAGRTLASARRGITSSFPAPGRVEQDAERVWASALEVLQETLARAGARMDDVAALGVTSQRASIVVWERASGRVVAPMIVWSDLRGNDLAGSLREAGFPAWPQMPVCKLEAALDLVPDGRARAARGELLWGTLDSFLVWKLTGGALHATDLSNAWVTGYLDFARPGQWNAALIAHQGLSEIMFPRLVDSWGRLGETRLGLSGEAPLCAIMADQQAGMVAHGALTAGAWKASLGTSAVVMASTGAAPSSPLAALPPLALAGVGGEARFCFEGMVNTAGAFLDWLCGDLGLFDDARALEAAAIGARDNGGVAIRPSLQGLGAPEPALSARGVITGLSGASGRGQIARAALEGLAFRLREIVEVVAEFSAMARSSPLPTDGGAAGDGFLQILADVLDRPVQRHAVREATALGAGLAAGIGIGLLGEGDLPRLARYDATFEPRLGRDASDQAYAAWRAAF